MAVSNKYARRRRNAVLAAIVMALIIILIVIIIISAASGRGKKPTITTTPTPTFPGLVLPTLAPTPELGLEDPTTTDEELLVTPTPDANAGIVMFVSKDGVNVRKEASTSADVVTVLSKGTTVTAYQLADGFYEVKLSDGKTGYISSSLLSEEDPKATGSTPTAEPTATPDTSKGTKMFVTGDGVNIRKSNSTDSEVAANLVLGKEVTAYAKVGDWTYIKYGTNKYGYILTKYLSDKAPATATPAGTLTPKPSSSATATLQPSPTAGTTGLTSFADLNIAKEVAKALDNSAEYKDMISSFNGLRQTAFVEDQGYYKYSKTGIELYILFDGTVDAPTNVRIATSR